MPLTGGSENYVFRGVTVHSSHGWVSTSVWGSRFGKGSAQRGEKCI